MIDAEAASLGSEIHDELVPLLFASHATIQRLIHGLDENISAEDLDRLHTVETWLSSALKKSRDMISGVFPADFASVAWPQRAQDRLALLHPDASGCIDWKVAPSAAPLPTEVAFAALRISVEACRNAIRHGQASAIVVSAEIIESSFVMTIQDNGVGFDTSVASEGRFGLLSMKQRAESLDAGALCIQSDPGQGTNVQFTVPVTG